MPNIVNWLKQRYSSNPSEITFHPKLNIPIKYLFSIGNKPYYQCVNEYEMPSKRLAFAKKFYIEMQNRITSEVLLDFINATKERINEGKLGEAYRLMDELEYRTKWLFDPESVMRFASVLYFDLEENIYDYDFEYNLRKISEFEKKKLLGTFLKMLFEAQSALSNLSEQDLQEYLLKLQPLKDAHQRLTSEKEGTNSK